MKNVIARINAELLIKIPNKEIYCLFIGEEKLGFIFEDKSARSGAIYTPFTSQGLLAETRCFECAVKSLIHRRTSPDVFVPCDRRIQSVSLVLTLLADRPSSQLLAR